MSCLCLSAVNLSLYLTQTQLIERKYFFFILQHNIHCSGQENTRPVMSQKLLKESQSRESLAFLGDIPSMGWGGRHIKY